MRSQILAKYVSFYMRYCLLSLDENWSIQRPLSLSGPFWTPPRLLNWPKSPHRLGLILVSGFGMKIADQIRTFKKHRPFFFATSWNYENLSTSLSWISGVNLPCVQSSKLRTFIFFLLVRRYNGTVERLTKYEKVEFDLIDVCFFCSQMLYVQLSMKDYIL